MATSSRSVFLKAFREGILADISSALRNWQQSLRAAVIYAVAITLVYTGSILLHQAVKDHQSLFLQILSALFIVVGLEIASAWRTIRTKEAMTIASTNLATAATNAIGTLLKERQEQMTLNPGLKAVIQVLIQDELRKARGRV
jgi:hypothetical protein